MLLRFIQLHLVIMILNRCFDFLRINIVFRDGSVVEDLPCWWLYLLKFGWETCRVPKYCMGGVMLRFEWLVCGWETRMRQKYSEVESG